VRGISAKRVAEQGKYKGVSLLRARRGLAGSANSGLICILPDQGVADFSKSASTPHPPCSESREISAIKIKSGKALFRAFAGCS
jgi:hypothetical protein